jgi:glycosyltransferase involved in cell wall biosynthesis
MRIAHVTYTFKPIRGGADAYLAQLYDLLDRQGHEQVVYQRLQRISPGEGRPARIRFLRNPFRGLPADFWTQALSLPLEWWRLSRFDAAIFHYPIYLLACLPPRISGRPLIVGLSHGVTWDDSRRSVKSKIKRAVARAAFRAADLYVANDTNFLREMGIAAPPAQGPYSNACAPARAEPGKACWPGARVAPRAWFIPNAVDIEYFRPVPPDPRLQALNAILVPRNLFFNRGVHLAIRAFAIFSKRYPDTNLVIAGHASQPRYAERLRRLARDLSVRSRVIFWGPAERRQMPSLYSASLMTLIPSVAGEGTSLAALESMACGTATISTDIGGLADLPAVKTAAIAEDLAEAMLDTFPIRAEVGARQRQQVEEGFSLPIWEKAWGEVTAEISRLMP